jgi:hypothetical protein
LLKTEDKMTATVDINMEQIDDGGDLSTIPKKTKIQKNVVLPGDEIEIKLKNNNKEIVIGPGLKKESQNTLTAIKCGILKQRDNHFFWIDSKSKRVIDFITIYHYFL